MATKQPKPQFTKEEIARERNRRKCLNYQQKYREDYRKYQREYSAANRNDLKNIRYRLVLRIKKLEQTIADLKPQLDVLDQQMAKRALDEAKLDATQAGSASNPFGIPLE